MKFYNRKNELGLLEKIYKNTNKKFQLCVIYGRRRVGKTELAGHFIKQKKGIYLFIEVKSNALLLNELAQCFEKELGFKPQLNTWDDFFKILLAKFKDKKFIIIFDEFQNFNQIDKALFSKFQKYIDKLQNSKVMMIIIGSYVGLMKKIFMSKKQPLFGRADNILRLKPFTFIDSVGLLNDLGFKKFEDQVLLYGIFHGIPKYLSYLQYNRKDIKSIIKELFLINNAPLIEEGKNILIQEFGSEHKGYFSILEAIANGCNTPDKIKQNTGIPSNTISKYITELRDYYEIINRIIPVTKKQTTKQSRYCLSDNFYCFWFRFIYKNISAIQFSFAPEPVLQKIMADLPAYLGNIYEQVCLEYLLLKYSKKPGFIISEFGKWWTGAERDEIDIVILSKSTIYAVFAECKYRNRKVNVSMIRGFQNRIDKFKWHNKKQQQDCYYFSKNGFDSKALDYCRQNKIVPVVGLKEMW